MTTFHPETLTAVETFLQALVERAEAQRALEKQQLEREAARALLAVIGRADDA